MSRVRHRAAAAVVVTIMAAAAACGAPASGGGDDAAAEADSSATSVAAEPASPESTPAEPAVVDACPDDADAALPPAEQGAGSLDGTDPREITGPSTATISDDVQPVTGSADPALPVIVRSCDGVEVTVTDVSRIVTADLYGTLGEIVFTLGLGDNVVGRDTSMGFDLAAHVPVVTPGGHDLNAEAILNLDPTLVLTDASIGPPEVQQQLREAGVPVIFFSDSRTLEGVDAHIRAVAGAVGLPDVGEELVERVEGEIAGALALAPADVEPLRATFLYIRGTAGVYLMAGPRSGADSLIGAIGAVDVGTDIGLTNPFTPLTSEALISAQPDVIIMMTNGLESVDGVDGLLTIPGIAQIPAGENRRIVDMNDADLLNFGPRSGETIRALAEAVYRP